MGCKNVFAFGCFALFLFVISTSMTSAMLANYTNNTGTIERALKEAGTTNLVNFTIGAESDNITQVMITISGFQEFDLDRYIEGSNGTNAENFAFSNLSTSSSVTAVFSNVTTAGIIANGTKRNFWFNLNSRSQGSSTLSVSVNVTGPGAAAGQTNISASQNYAITFRFSGTVKNDSGGVQNATNVTLYDYQIVPNGPPTETALQSVVTGPNGNFTMTGISAAAGKLYKLHMISYNVSNSSHALKVGTILPPFPPELFYPPVFGGGGIDMPAFEFMKPPSLNGTTFYVGPAATININATNGTTGQLFGYMIMEQGTGFAIASNIMGNVSSASIVVPTGRKYTAMTVRANSQFVTDGTCNGLHMNNTGCQTPPRSNSSIQPTIEGQNININMNMAVTRVQMYGCINVTGNDTMIRNVTAIFPRMLPWSGFVPPMTPDTGSIDLTSTAQLNYSDWRCATEGNIAFYNISLLSADYLVEFHGRNNTAASLGEYKTAFQNVSFTGAAAGTNRMVNVTMERLSGSFVAATSATEINTTKFILRVQNSSGGALTQDTPHIEVTIKNPIMGEMTYIFGESANGTINIAIPRNSTARAKVFSNNAPPKEKILNLSAGFVNLTLVTMGAGGDAGFKRKNASGQLETMNITKSGFGMAMKFIRSSSDCDVISPDSSCTLTEMNASGFNPFSAMVAGKINMEMKMSGSSVSIVFYNFDMFSAKQPPMESVMDSQAVAGAGSANQVWEFGSFVPADVYDYAVVGIPYSDTLINESADINMKIPVLYDENWNVAYNVSRGDGVSNISYNVDPYIEGALANNRSFNSTGYSGFFGAAGVTCSKTNSTITGSNPSVYCFVNTTSNMLYMRVPHFSGVGPNIQGSAPASSSGSTGSTSGGGGGSGITTTKISETQLEAGYTKSMAKDTSVSFNISGVNHNVKVVSVSNQTVTITVSSTPQTATLSIGETKQFDVSGDGKNDIIIKLDGISAAKEAILTIKSILSSSPSGSNARDDSTRASDEGLNQNEEIKSGDLTGKGRTVWLWIVIIIAIVVATVLYFKKRK